MVRWKRLKHWPVHLAFALTQMTEIHLLKGCVIGGRFGAMTHLAMISYKRPAGACDGRAQVTLGYSQSG